MGDGMIKQRELSDLVSVGKATLEDFDKLGIRSVSQLSKADAMKLYEKLCRVTGVRHDPCVIDVFSCAIAQARNKRLPKEQCQWWYWSRLRKGNHGKKTK